MLRLGFPDVEVLKTLPAPCHQVWDLLVDTTQWPRWGPSVAAVSCPDRRIGKGSTGWIETPFGLRAPFRITAYEEGRLWAWTVCGIPATGHRVDSLGGGRCRLTFTVPTVAAPYVVICWIAAERIAAILK